MQLQVHVAFVAQSPFAWVVYEIKASSAPATIVYAIAVRVVMAVLLDIKYGFEPAKVAFEVSQTVPS